jgi:phytoene desaturase
MFMNKKSIIIIGSGIGGLGAAVLFAKKGYTVTVLEKNEQLGGRASTFSVNLENGHNYTFDMGPSWYLMPDVFAHFFSLLDEKVEDHLDLQPLSPSYRIFAKEENKENINKSLIVDMFSNIPKTCEILEDLEKGSGEKFEQYLKASKEMYDIAYAQFMFKNYNSFFDILSWKVLMQGVKLNILSTMHVYVQKFFKRELVQKIMQYTLVFLGSSPFNTPALYSIMTHIDFSGGVFYPKGGIYEITKALVSLGKKYGVAYKINSEVIQIITKDKKAIGVKLSDDQEIFTDIVISNSDMHHSETKLLQENEQTYKQEFWDKKVISPSAFILYLGISKTFPSLSHHNLLFAKDWKSGFSEIFDFPQMPSDPSLYVCAPSKTDDSVAPNNCENLFVLVPIAPNLTLSQLEKESYKDKILETLEQEMGCENLREHIEYCKIFETDDFKSRYFSFKGTALGLAHTLTQSAFMRPNNVSKKVENLYYVGAGTNPGIGMPICLISAELVYKRIEGIENDCPLEKL